MNTLDQTTEFRRQLRSLFAALRAIIRRSSDGESTKGEFAARLEGRVGVLARIHEMLTRAPAVAIDLEELVRAELVAQAVPAQQCAVSGPDTRIALDAAGPLALAMHELAVNALLHGALGETDGSLEVK